MTQFMEQGVLSSKIEAEVVVELKINTDVIICSFDQILWENRIA